MSVFVAANSPEIIFEVDFTNDPTNATRAYTDVTIDVRQLAYSRSGRNNELQRSEPGTLTGVLNNRHGYYDPSNTASPRYPGVKRMRWCRVSAVWLGVTYRRWTGLIEVWKQEWPASGKDAAVTISGVDALKVLNLFDLDNKSYGSQLTSARVSAVLTDAGITASTVATGASTIAESPPGAPTVKFSPGSSALAHLMDVEESENGLLFADGDGKIVFQDRHYRLTTTASKTSQGTIGDLSGDIRYRTGSFDLDDAFLWNTAVVTPQGGTEEVATDAVSKASYFERRLTRSILSSSQTDALNTAQFLVQRYADPSSRIPSVELIGAADTSKWPVILGAVNSNRFKWRRSTTAHTILEEVFVERVGDVVTPGQAWRVMFDLSPAIDQAGWIAGDATYSLAGQTTRAVY